MSIAIEELICSTRVFLSVPLFSYQQLENAKKLSSARSAAKRRAEVKEYSHGYFSSKNFTLSAGHPNTWKCL